MSIRGAEHKRNYFAENETKREAGFFWRFMFTEVTKVDYLPFCLCNKQTPASRSKAGNGTLK